MHVVVVAAARNPRTALRTRIWKLLMCLLLVSAYCVVVLSYGSFSFVCFFHVLPLRSETTKQQRNMEVSHVLNVPKATTKQEETTKNKKKQTNEKLPYERTTTQ